VSERFGDELASWTWCGISPFCGALYRIPRHNYELGVTDEMATGPLHTSISIRRGTESIFYLPAKS
jgi:hypothetical protein